MLAELAAANAAFSVLKQCVSNGKELVSAGNAIAEFVGAKETLQQLSLLTQSRVQAPQGISGGDAGMCGEQVLIRMDGTQEAMDSLEQVTVYPGDRLVIRTPGGGGAGEAELLA